MTAKFTEAGGLTLQSLGKREGKYSSIQGELEYWMTLPKNHRNNRKNKEAHT